MLTIIVIIIIIMISIMIMIMIMIIIIIINPMRLLAVDVPQVLKVAVRILHDAVVRGVVRAAVLGSSQRGALQRGV